MRFIGDLDHITSSLNNFPLNNYPLRLEAGQGLKGKSHGGQNRKLTPEFLNEIQLKFSTDPFMSMQKCAIIMGCNEKTIRCAREKLGMTSKNNRCPPLPNRIKEEKLEETLKLNQETDSLSMNNL